MAPGAPFVVVLSFELTALLYLVAEELLVEAYEVPKTMAATAMIFAGCLILMMITIVSET